jgi:hypothetical protein
MQGFAIALSTPTVVALARPWPQARTSSDVVHMLRLTYLLLAVGVAFTKTRFVHSTSKAIADASRKMNRSEPAAGAYKLLLCLWVGAIGMASITIVSPPTPSFEDGWLFGHVDAAAILWPAATSIGVAVFGASAQAANQGLADAEHE